METEAEVIPEAPKEVASNKKSLAVGQRGELALLTLEDQLGFAKKLIDEKMISDTFKTPQQVVVAFQYAKVMGLPEILAVKMMYVVNGRPSLFAEGPLSLVQRNPKFKSIREYFINEAGDEISPKNKNLKEKVWGAVCEVMRQGDTEPQVDYFTLDDLALAKLDKNSKGEKKDVWAKWERLMLRYKARAIALRSKFADLIAGIPIAEYDFNHAPEMPMKDVTGSDLKDFNEKYLKTTTEAEQPASVQ
jgi:hypothetical protein